LPLIIISLYFTQKNLLRRFVCAKRNIVSISFMKINESNTKPHQKCQIFVVLGRTKFLVFRIISSGAADYGRL